ncbi:STAS domain-containing protein [Hydrogenophaga sp. OTU3427]|uniref:STAS domain-containing protein n=1 Tax=Hydrogenophaga sp. OTU3427 TaxID=3043856 RepID=UPI00313DD292
MNTASSAALALPARLTHADAVACLAALQQQAGAATGPVVVDASALQDFDSTALAALLSLRRWALSQGRALEVRRLPARLAELVALYGVGELLPA